MGKTFKSGYMSLGHSFNSLYNHQCLKKTDRRKRKIKNKYDCDWLYRTCDTPEINMTVKNNPANNTYRKPFKMGYCPNSSENLDDVKKYIYESCKFTNKNINGLYNYKTLYEREKINILMDEANYKIDNGNEWLVSEITTLKNMEKQIKRRGKIGYFKGYNKKKRYLTFNFT
jgi:hypothetical protein